MSRALIAKPGAPERIVAIAEFIAHDQQREAGEMIEHHRGGIVMARALLDGDGRNVYTHGLAKHVVNEQTDENEAMAALL
jgi:Domain of unknown function (DUF305)